MIYTTLNTQDGEESLVTCDFNREGMNNTGYRGVATLFC